MMRWANFCSISSASKSWKAWWVIKRLIKSCTLVWREASRLISQIPIQMSGREHGVQCTVKMIYQYHVVKSVRMWVSFYGSVHMRHKLASGRCVNSIINYVRAGGTLYMLGCNTKTNIPGQYNTKTNIC